MVDNEKDEYMEDLPRRVREAVNRSELEHLVNKHFLTADHRRTEPEWFDSMYTPDFVLVLPHGTYQGHGDVADAVAASAEFFGRSHHLASNNVVELDGNLASVRAKLIATHLARADEPSGAFTGGAEYSFEAVYTDGGWRLSRAEYKGVWTRGEAPALARG